MYPSSSYYGNNINNNNHHISSSFTLDQDSPYKPSIYEINSNSKIEDPPYNFPSSYINFENDIYLEQQMYDLYLQQQPQVVEVNAPDPIRTEMTRYFESVEELKGECSSKQNEGIVTKETPRKRTSKKDRHSKIETAQGPRDRRMRLSLQVARDFFDLQDMLGYNKASKTVEWLLSKSRAAIKDLTSCSAISGSSTSECEDVSQEKGKHLVSTPTKETKSSTRGSTRKPAFNPRAKESREKARARARERTKEKKKGDGSKSTAFETMGHQMNPLGSWGQSDNNSPQLEMLDDVGELSTSMMLNYVMHNHGIPQEHQFTDSNVYGKPWEAYNNTNLR